MIGRQDFPFGAILAHFQGRLCAVSFKEAIPFIIAQKPTTFQDGIFPRPWTGGDSGHG